MGAGGPGAEYGGYLRRLRRRIQETLQYPAAARRRGLSGTVLVEVNVQPDGSIGAVAVVTSSGHEVLDEAALEAIKSLRREPFPPGLPPRLIRVHLPVVFALD